MFNLLKQAREALEHAAQELHHIDAGPVKELGGLIAEVESAAAALRPTAPIAKRFPVLKSYTAKSGRRFMLHIYCDGIICINAWGEDGVVVYKSTIDLPDTAEFQGVHFLKDDEFGKAVQGMVNLTAAMLELL